MQKAKKQPQIKKLVTVALAEDVGEGDITTCSVVDSGAVVQGNILIKEAGVVCGLVVAREVFQQVDKRIKFTAKTKDGDKVKKGQIIATISGPARGILTGERVALNFLQRLSGIATLTSQFVLRATNNESRATILDTRKTAPGLRALEKYAVKCGGGTNHRLGLWDAVLIKDNHIALAGGVEVAIKKAKGKGLGKAKVKEVEIECKTLIQVKEAIKIGVSIILLDNMNLKTLRKAIKLCKQTKIKTEASGGVNLKTVRAIAKTGVDYISVGALTHSAKALDISLDLRT